VDGRVEEDTTVDIEGVRRSRPGEAITGDGMEEERSAEISTLQHSISLSIAGIVTAHEADLEADAGIVRRGDAVLSERFVESERFLAEDITVVTSGKGDDIRVRVGCCGDDGGAAGWASKGFFGAGRPE
jgi:hypothetical protein